MDTSNTRILSRKIHHHPTRYWTHRRGLCCREHWSQIRIHHHNQFMGTYYSRHTRLRTAKTWPSDYEKAVQSHPVPAADTCTKAQLLWMNRRCPIMLLVRSFLFSFESLCGFVSSQYLGKKVFDISQPFDSSHVQLRY